MALGMGNTQAQGPHIPTAPERKVNRDLIARVSSGSMGNNPAQGPGRYR